MMCRDQGQEAAERARRLLVEAHRDFRIGLPARVDRLRAALERLSAGFEREAADSFYHAAHSLKGTAPSFGASGLATAAAELSALARGWLGRGGVDGAELEGAGAILDRLEDEVKRFVAKPKDEEPA